MNYIKTKWKQFLIGFIALFVSTVFASELLPTTANIQQFDFNGTTIKTPYTDDNIDENLIIRTDQTTYGGWNRANVYFSIENISKATEIVDIQFYFSGEETLSEISELAENVPYQVVIRDYGVKDYECEKNWIATTTSEMGEEYTRYICGEDIKYCDTVKDLICTIDNDFIGTHEETRYKDKFHGLALAESKVLSQAIPVNFQAQKKAVYNIPAGEIKFFKAIINFEPKSEGEFLIYAEKSK